MVDFLCCCGVPVVLFFGIIIMEYLPFVKRGLGWGCVRVGEKRSLAKTRRRGGEGRKGNLTQRREDAERRGGRGFVVDRMNRMESKGAERRGDGKSLAEARRRGEGGREGTGAPRCAGLPGEAWGGSRRPWRGSARSWRVSSVSSSLLAATGWRKAGALGKGLPGDCVVFARIKPPAWPKVTPEPGRESGMVLQPIVGGPFP